MSLQPIRIVKLGGSLLDWPNLARQLPQWFAAQTPAMNVVVVGGGEFAEEVRRLDGIHHLSARDAHWLAAETMQITAKLVAKLLPSTQGIQRFARLAAEAQPEPGVVIFDAWQFLCEVEPTLPGDKLPEDWTTTSDSISARVARALQAEELVLLKSALPAGLPASATAAIEALAAAEYVDAALPQMAAGIQRIRCVDLRDDRFAECRVVAR
jgi:aspartokinase-like uncharacterized kinase